MSNAFRTATRSDMPTDATSRDEDQPFRVWQSRDWATGGKNNWVCLASFFYLSCFLEYLADCQDKGVLVVRQCPLGVSEVTPDMPRVVAK